MIRHVVFDVGRVFVRLENVAAARARGWHGVVHSDPDTTISAMRDLGVT